MNQPPEIPKSQYGPDREQQIGFRFHGAEGQQVGNQQQCHKNEHQDNPDHSGYRFRPVSAPLRVPVNTVGYQPVDDCRPQCGHIHNPADGRPAEERNKHRQENHSNNRIPGNAVFVQLRGLLRCFPVSAGSVQQPAQCHQVADQAGQDDSEQRQHQDHQSGIAQVMARRVESRNGLNAFQVSHVPDVIQPGGIFRRIGGNGQQGYKQVQHRRQDNRGDQDPADLFHRESVLFREMGDVLKADKGPRGNGRDADNLPEG